MTRITNKHLLAVYDEPMICYPIEAMVTAGIGDIMVVTSGNHDGEFLRLLGDGREFGPKHLSYIYQDTAGGIAEALGLAEHFVDNDRFNVMRGDNILEQIDDPRSLRHLGVPVIENGRLFVIREKLQNPPSPYAVIGVYMSDPSVFEIVRYLKPLGRGELELIDVNNAYIDRSEMAHDVIDGFWGDAGESIDVYHEVIDFVRRNGANRTPAGGAS